MPDDGSPDAAAPPVHDELTPRGRKRWILAGVAAAAVSTVAALAFWSAPGGGSGTATAGTLDAATISTSASTFDTIKVSWDQQASLQPSGADNGAITYSVERRLGSGAWAALASGGCSGSLAHGVASCSDTPGAPGSYSYRTLARYHTWSAGSNEAGPAAVSADTTPPVNAITLSDVSGGAFKSGDTVYYRGTATGSFTLTNAVSDSGPALPASSRTSALTGTSTGWSHSPSTVTTPSGGPYVSNPFAWTASSSSSPSETVTGADTGANTAATALTFTDDSVAPTGGSADVTGLVGTGGRYSTSTTLNVTFAAGTDGGAGLGASPQLMRASAALANGACGTYGPGTQVGADDPSSPFANTVPADETCYRYRYVVSDRVGNQTTYTAPDVKVDTTAPAAPSLAFSATTAASATGSAVYYRSAAASGSFTLTASATDASGIASYTTPTLPAGWTSTAGAAGVKTYSWAAASPTVPTGLQNSTATNNATLTSGTAGFTVTSDNTAPTGGNVAYPNGYVTSASVPVTFSAGTDGGSGINTSTGLLQRREATLSATGTCGTFGVTWVTVPGGTNPTSPFADTSVATSKCYVYRYLISDKVGNQVTTYTSANNVKVDTVAPAIARATVAKNATSTAGTVRQGAAYTVYASVSDAASAPTTVANTSSFDSGVTAQAMTTVSVTVDGQSYNRSATLTADTPLTTGSTYGYTVTATDLAGNSATTSPEATIEAYSTVVGATAGLASYWRFNDSPPAPVDEISADDFTDTAGTELSSHTGALGASWTAATDQTSSAVISPAGRLRKSAGAGYSQYVASGVPSSANYLVEADVYVASIQADDSVALIGRADAAGTTYYMARYITSSGVWQLLEVTAGTGATIGTPTQVARTLTVGASYRVGLQMNGSTISLIVDGVTIITGTDASPIAAAGRAGLRNGLTTGAGTGSDTAGLHLDDFRVATLATGAVAADSEGANAGTYANGPLLDQPGALVGDSNRAAKLDGVNDYVTVPDAATLDVGDTFTLEAWVKRSSTGGGIRDMFNKGLGTFVLAFNTNNTVFLGGDLGTLGPASVITTSPTAVADTTTWHHVVATKAAATASKLYIDGVDRTGTVSNSTLGNSSSALILGAKAGTSEFLGATIDEFALYNTALTAATVLDHYKAGTGTG
jgi:concanavalin A-like lectin/glucanase superfamily protein